MRSLYAYGFLVGAHIGGVDRASNLPALIEPQMFIASSLFPGASIYSLSVSCP